MNNRHSLAQQALAISKGTPNTRHDPGKCEVCALDLQGYVEFSRQALPELAQGYLDAAEELAKAHQDAAARQQFLKELHAEGDALSRDLDSRSARAQELASQLVERDAQLESLQRERDSLISITRELQTALQRESAANQTVVASLKGDLDGQAFEVVRLRQEFDAAVLNAGQLESGQGLLVATLTAERDVLRTERDSLLEKTTRLDEARRAAERQFESERAGFRATLDVSRVEAAALQADLRRATADAGARMEALKTEKTVLTQRLEEFGELISHLKAERADERRIFSSRISDLQSAAEAAEHRSAAAVAEVQLRLTDSLDRVRELEARHSRATDNSSVERDAIKRDLDNTARRAELLSEELKLMTAGRATDAQLFKDDIAKRSRTVEELQSEIRKADAMRQSERLSLEDAISSGKSALDTMKKDLAARATLVGLLQQDVEAGKSRIAELGTQLRERETHSVADLSLRAELDARAGKLEEVVRQMTAGAAAMKRDLDASARDAAALSEKLKVAISSRDADAQSFHDDIAKQSTKVDELQNEILQMQREVESGKSRASDLEAELRRSTGVSNAELEELRRELNDVKSKRVVVTETKETRALSAAVFQRPTGFGRGKAATREVDKEQSVDNSPRRGWLR